MTKKQKLQQLYAARRRALIRRVSREHKVDAALITNQVDIRYLSGATEGVFALLIAPRTAALFTSKMFEERVPREAPGCKVVVAGSRSFREADTILRKCRHRRALGYQGGQLVVAHYRTLTSAMGKRKLVDIGGAVTLLRSVKDDGELRVIRKCVRIAEEAFLDLVGRGASYLMKRTERQIAAEFEYRMCELGADRQAFPFNGIIVAAGPNSASCHHFPGRRKPRRGEPLLFDWGAEKDGYRCDITRVVFMGNPDNEMKKIFEVVREANAAGIRAIKSGVACARVARAGWGVVRDAGYGEQIRHGLGHGLGLDIHEPPGFGAGGSRPTSAKDVRLKKNMVVTIEPGIYIEGKGGVRLEDDVLVTVGGRKRLTSLPTDLRSAILRR